ncbi:NADH-quinone oxidoreductase subunit C [Streptantibioticus rubrisoli]|uniref:NADH-quinone oxidoreductase subunit C n=1 Tax=Streptantibioticus rubrisoli TaxID=1387313 RepID=A0ABT1PQI9_9ACTN|nr:NADH-quinone oxidoreductase subunit C [Streptantibioticus rubrisoli]MCQ4046498.1 NADH-quinone oxidoreductase subunit C [Streptantibioticus rubrisoli]
MTAFDRLPEAAAEIFGAEATAEEAYGLLTVDVPAASWITALETARDELGCGYFDWLSAVDEPGTGFQVCAHLADPGHGGVRHLVLRTTVPHDAPELPTATGVYAGAAWHERETHEMFGVRFTGHPHLVPLLLPEGFEGHPLRKDFVLAARVAKAWPGAKEPGEPAAGTAHGGPKRRQMLPPGVPDPNEWGPLKGQLPPAPARPARAAAGERPARRTRSVSEGSASQAAPAGSTSAPERPARRARTASEGSASQRAAAEEPSAEGAPAPERPAPRRRTSDAPWNLPRETAESEAARGTQEPTEPGAAGSEARRATARPDASEPEAPRATPEPDVPEPEAASERTGAETREATSDEGGDTQ